MQYSVIGLVVATTNEANAVLSKFSGTPQMEKKAGFTVFRFDGALEGHHIYMVRCGVGLTRAAIATQYLVSEYHADLIVNFGVAGDLEPDSVSETPLCLVTFVSQWDFDLSTCDPVPQGQHPDRASRFLPTTPELIKDVNSIIPNLRQVYCTSGNTFVASEKKKLEIAKEFYSEICDMEAYGVVEAAGLGKVPCLVLKAIADGLSGGQKEYYEKCPDAAEIVVETFVRIIKGLLEKS